jgi:hypothetical protein
MDERALDFIRQNPSAAMTTLRADGSVHAVRVGVGVVEGKIWSSGTQTRVRTSHLRRDPRSTLFVFESGQPAAAFRWLALEATVTILEGADVPELHVQMFQDIQSRLPSPPKAGRIIWYGQEKTLEEFRQAMIDEKRLIYQFDVIRTYGMY